MDKAYSNKALPSGTVLREWRLEEVLGVGGFGIVYKGRGIYFDELVAIKEYFPSAISERKDGDTVVPIDSSAEEVHALGLKKFVEEAKLLWNLSSPTRHPNIVSVRSLFEIHGTAYIVMDFEDGFSLSKLLKQGKRFNEASLTALIQPIAEGLERAHRVGVLHRDIKPPNILVNEDGRPVLIDFGSARFESGDATSTKVTFYTPPYAAIEQYVKTYAQGPWTDIYALGVVMHECVTGAKPPEVLERMHGGLGKPLADGNWPGYSRTFLAAVDAAMNIRPDERPQSISEWLALFDQEEASSAAPVTAKDDEEATRILVFDPLAEKIVPVAPPPPGFDRAGNVETAVPTSTSEVEFKGPGQLTNASKKAKDGEDLHRMVSGAKGKQAGPEAKAEAGPEAGPPSKVEKSQPAPARIAATTGNKEPLREERSKRPMLIGAGVVGAILLAGGGYLATQGSADAEPDPALAASVDSTEVVAVEVNGADGLAEAVQALATDAATASAPAAAVKDVAAAGTSLATLYSGLSAITDASGKASRVKEMSTIALSASSTLAGALLQQADSRLQRLSREFPWVYPGSPNSAQGVSAEHRRIAGDLRASRASLATAAAGASSATEPGPALTAARQALAASQSLAAAYARAVRSSPPTQTQQAAMTEATLAATAPATATTAAPATQARTTASSPAADRGPAGSASELFPQKFRTFNSTVSAARAIAANVIRLGRGSEPGSGASDSDKYNYRVRQANVKTAQEYSSYLDTLANSMRGVRSEREVDELIASANQTRSYLTALQATSSAAK